MAIPGVPLQVCALVSYAMGFANPNNTPNIGIYAMVSAVDAGSAGIKMRVERCTGSGCSSFAFRGNSNGVQFAASPAPQAEFIDSGVYATIYRYRVRLENNDGNGPYSSIVQIDTTIQGTSACDSGAVTDFQDQLNATGLRSLTESTLIQVQSTGLRSEIEHSLAQVQGTGLRSEIEHTLSQVQATGLRIIIEYIESNLVDLVVNKSSDNPTPLVGENFTWTTTVHNISSNDATGVVLNDVIPSGVFFISYISSQGTYDPVSGVWNVGDLAAGVTATIAIVVKAGIIPGPLTNTAIATANEPEITPGNNTDSDTIVIQPPIPPVSNCPPEIIPPVPPIGPGECPPIFPEDTINYTSPFRLYQKDVEVRLKSWGDDSAYAIVRPYGGDSFNRGATI